MVRTHLSLLALISSVAAFGACDAGPTLEDTGEIEERGLAVAAATQDLGERLFTEETFDGNGRTCQTCHGAKTGTVSPADARKRLAKDPNDPLFEHDGSDDGHGNGTSRMTSVATVLVTIALPENVSIADDPTARTVTLLRGVPSTMNTPALDPVLMYDGRQPDLESQADGAIGDHALGREATEEELEAIAEFQQTDKRFFSSTALRKYAGGTGPAPELPPGVTESEKRGRPFFLPDGPCGNCHGGPMLNETSVELEELLAGFGVLLPAGTRFENVLVSEANHLGNPVRDFLFEEPDGSVTVVTSADPGRALVSGNPTDDDGNFLLDHANRFKINTLWGIRHTAPYFHDNSAATLEAVMDHYAEFFFTGEFTEQDKADMVAYMMLL